uniref:Uncharacterized protein n=1 Tax=Siphoviridae sp. ctnsL8 TaxID=2825666 RepID=A0A8S5PMB5_9CAUD|nr:MAG TPA: hypothetical protein [Siphoviridae sp. ctnsL8]
MLTCLRCKDRINFYITQRKYRIIFYINIT